MVFSALPLRTPGGGATGPWGRSMQGRQAPLPEAAIGPGPCTSRLLATRDVHMGRLLGLDNIFSSGNPSKPMGRPGSTHGLPQWVTYSNPDRDQAMSWPILCSLFIAPSLRIQYVLTILASWVCKKKRIIHGLEASQRTTSQKIKLHRCKRTPNSLELV